jgi:hypothetical protein
VIGSDRNLVFADFGAAARARPRNPLIFRLILPFSSCFRLLQCANVCDRLICRLLLCHYAFIHTSGFNVSLFFKLAIG